MHFLLFFSAQLQLMSPIISPILSTAYPLLLFGAGARHLASVSVSYFLLEALFKLCEGASPSFARCCCCSGISLYSHRCLQFHFLGVEWPDTQNNTLKPARAEVLVLCINLARSIP